MQGDVFLGGEVVAARSFDLRSQDDNRSRCAPHSQPLPHRRAPGVALAQRVAFALGVTLSAAKGLSCRETSFLG